jgi:hypothetical protein
LPIWNIALNDLWRLPTTHTNYIAHLNYGLVPDVALSKGASGLVAIEAGVFRNCAGVGLTFEHGLPTIPLDAIGTCKGIVPELADGSALTLVFGEIFELLRPLVVALVEYPNGLSVL